MAYRIDETNRCPGCEKCNWHIGRLYAECAFCGWAVPLNETAPMNPEYFKKSKQKDNVISIFGEQAA